MKPTLLILAAGRGSRFGGAKQVNPMGPSGETIMEYSIFDALTSGFGKVVLVINREVEQGVKEIIEKLGVKSDEVSYAFQDEYSEHLSEKIQSERLKPWGTGHAILCAESEIETPFAMINADDFYGKDSFHTMATFLSSHGKDQPRAFSMVGYDLLNTLSENGSVSRGISISDRDGKLSSITERHGIFEEKGKIFFTEENDLHVEITSGLASMNFWGFQPIIFQELHRQFVEFLETTPNPKKDEFVIPAVIDTMITQGKIDVSVLHSSAKWFGVTYQEDRPIVVDKLQQFAENEIYPTPLSV